MENCKYNHLAISLQDFANWNKLLPLLSQSLVTRGILLQLQMWFYIVFHQTTLLLAFKSSFEGNIASNQQKARIQKFPSSSKGILC